MRRKHQIKKNPKNQHIGETELQKLKHHCINLKIKSTARKDLSVFDSVNVF